MAGNVGHCASIRMKLLGIGNLDLVIQSDDDIVTVALPPIAMSTTSYKQPQVITNTMLQSARLQGSTNEINEVMRINSICFFVKPVWSGFPQ